MATKTPSQIVEKYKRGVSGAGADYAAGVSSPSRPWAESTVKGAERWQVGLQEAFAKGSFQKGVNAAGNGKWQQRASTVGKDRYAASATVAAEAYQAKAGKIMEAANAAQQAVSNMPNDTYEARKARANAAMDAVHKYWENQ